MEVSNFSPIDKCLIGICAIFGGISVVVTHALLALAIYCSITGHVDIVDLGFSFLSPALFWAGLAVCLNLKDSETRKLTCSTFWNQVPTHAPWLKCMPTQVFALLAVTTICLTAGILEQSWHVATVHFSPIVIPPEARDLNKIFHFNVQSLADTLLNVAGAACIPSLALLLAHDRYYLPRCVKRWNLELSKTDCEYEQIELLDIITTSNLYMKRFADAEETSSLMLKIAAQGQKRAAG